jgi:predicted HicB family RNase H-like nuclease
MQFYVSINVSGALDVIYKQKRSVPGMKNLDENLKLKQLTLRMPETLHREFKLTAVKQGRTMGDVTIELIRQYLEKTSDPL